MILDFGASLLGYVAIVAGCILGLILGLMLYLPTANRFYPWITFLVRKMRGDAVPSRPSPPKPETADAWALCLSDLHIDTWDDSVIGPRTEALTRIMAWADGKIKRLILNGDLLDIPPHPNNQEDPHLLTIPNDWPSQDVAPAKNLEDPDVPLRPGSLQSRYTGILTSLFSSSAIHKIGLVGNHDIGINGLRFVAVGGKTINWSPGILIETQTKGRYIYIEHGHRHDAQIWVYTIYALIDILRGETQATGAQRGGRVGKAGRENERTIGTAANAVENYDPSNPEAGLTAGQLTNLRIYRAAAYRRLKGLRACGYDISAILMGHTHLPDRFQLDENTVYVNIGDWAGNGNHQTYALISHEGEVLGPYQWV
jgi:hypothetical protein